LSDEGPKKLASEEDDTALILRVRPPRAEENLLQSSRCGKNAACADICLRLSLIASDDEVSSRLIVMAQDYKAKGTRSRLSQSHR
jgi:hypothetical protein